MPETATMSPKVATGTSAEVGEVTTKVAAAKVSAPKVSTPATTEVSERIGGNRQAAKRQKCCQRKS
jgi:hypothetical protein